MTTHLTLFADYHQIHVLDELSESDLGEAWTEVAVRDGLAVAHDAVAIGTEDNLDVGVEVEILGSQPGDDSVEFDHVVEASLVVASGRIAVMGCTDYLPDAARFDVAPGAVRIRASRSSLEVVNRAEGDATIEHIRLQIWPAEPTGQRVIKRRSAPTAVSE